MKHMQLKMACLLAVLSFVFLVSAQDAVELRFMCFQESNECEVYDDLLSRFSQENPGITVAVEVVDETVIQAQLSEQIESGAAPDIARISDFAALKGHYLDLRPLLGDELEANFRYDYFGALRTSWHSDAEELHGFPDAVGVIAPFVNVSLFEQADVAVPGEGASWDEWLAALEAVVAATDATYALAVDNKDHRLVGPAMSLGARYFPYNKQLLTLPDVDGLGEFLQILHGLMVDGKTPADTLLGTGKSQEYFVRGETVMYICGSWKAEEVAAQVGDEFEWAIVSNPSGPGGSTGVAQATAVVALAGTEYPDAVAKVIDYLIRAEVSAEFAARTLSIPARQYLPANGIDYQTDNAVIAAALNGFAREALKLQDQAIALMLHPMTPFYYETSNRLLRAFFAGEISLDEALADLQEGIKAEVVKRAAG